MEPTIKAEWVAALRDPNAQQCKGLLGKVDGGRCCLGVLSDIAVKHGVIPPPREPKGDDEGGLIYGYEEDDRPDYSETELIEMVASWAGLPMNAQSVMVPEADEPVPLALVNDGRNGDEPGHYPAVRARTFSEIADLIEVQL